MDTTCSSCKSDMITTELFMRWSRPQRLVSFHCTHIFSNNFPSPVHLSKLHYNELLTPPGVVFVGSDRYLARVKSWDQLRNIGIVHCPLIHEKLNSDVIISGPGLADIGTNQLAPGQLISFSLMINTEKRPEVGLLKELKS